MGMLSFSATPSHLRSSPSPTAAAADALPAAGGPARTPVALHAVDGGAALGLLCCKLSATARLPYPAGVRAVIEQHAGPTPRCKCIAVDVDPPTGLVHGWLPTDRMEPLQLLCAAIVQDLSALILADLQAMTLQMFSVMYRQQNAEPASVWFQS